METYDISAEQGSTYTATIVYTNDAGNAVNLTGYTARMHVRRFAGSEYPHIVLTSTSGLSITANTGTIGMTIAPSALSAIPAGKYAYDLEIQSAEGLVEKLLKGDFELSAEVTR